MEEKTIFEKIIAREIPATIIYEDEKNIAFLDAFPFEKGHLLVVPKKVYRQVWEIPEEEFLELQKIILKLSKKIRNEMKCGLNILQNNCEIAGQVVDHVHFHLIPRIENKKLLSDGKNSFAYKDEDEKKELIDLLRIN